MDVSMLLEDTLEENMKRYKHETSIHSKITEQVSTNIPPPYCLE